MKRIDEKRQLEELLSPLATKSQDVVAAVRSALLGALNYAGDAVADLEQVLDDLHAEASTRGLLVDPDEAVQARFDEALAACRFGKDCADPGVDFDESGRDLRCPICRDEMCVCGEVYECEHGTDQRHGWEPLGRPREGEESGS